MLPSSHLILKYYYFITHPFYKNRIIKFKCVSKFCQYENIFERCQFRPHLRCLVYCNKYCQLWVKVFKNVSKHIQLCHWIEWFSFIWGNLQNLWPFCNSRHDKITGNLSTINSWARSMPVESYAIKNGARITAIVSHTKTKNSPLVQSGLEIPVSIKIEWENEINLERSKTKVSSLAYSLQDDYVDDFKDIFWQNFQR